MSSDNQVRSGGSSGGACGTFGADSPAAIIRAVAPYTTEGYAPIRQEPDQVLRPRPHRHAAACPAWRPWLRAQNQIVSVVPEERRVPPDGPAPDAVRPDLQDVRQAGRMYGAAAADSFRGADLAEPDTRRGDRENSSGSSPWQALRAIHPTGVPKSDDTMTSLRNPCRSFGARSCQGLEQHLHASLPGHSQGVSSRQQAHHAAPTRLPASKPITWRLTWCSCDQLTQIHRVHGEGSSRALWSAEQHRASSAICRSSQAVITRVRTAVAAAVMRCGHPMASSCGYFSPALPGPRVAGFCTVEELQCSSTGPRSAGLLVCGAKRA
jgi:hypothetical protein